MCGIFCQICYTSSNMLQDTKILERIKNRGPNKIQTVQICPFPGVCVIFHGAVLWMQGERLTPQPIENEAGILLYNGDIFDETWSGNVSDTQLIMDKLSQKSEISTEYNILQVFQSLKGPFSIIYYDKLTHDLYFVRDRIGRSTLLFHKNENSIILSNVLGRNYDCLEVPATHIYTINVKSKLIRKFSWLATSMTLNKSILEDWYEALKMQQSLPDDQYKFEYNEPNFNEEDDIIQYIDNVAKHAKNSDAIMKQLLDNSVIKEIIMKLVDLLQKSVEIRLKRQPNKCKDCLFNETVNCNHCTVGVLFSGGLDCTILALLADKYLPKEQSIDLINVAFKKDISSTYDVPDRITGRQSFEELKRLCPTRKWKFIEVDVPKEELEKFQLSTIADLVYPRQTILDESLGSALWFAARARTECDLSTCRVLLLGSGADELFGGYIRHRNAYKRLGWSGLHKELQLDWNRISFRNLARDNRVICDHGRQPRMPYLDENFTEFVLLLKPWLKCFPSENLPPGIGDKLMLRLLGHQLGLSEVVTLPKRALQFGSRIANKKEKGSDISKTFLNNKT